MNTLETIQQIVLDHPSHEILFNSPVQVKSSPHQLLFTCYGIHAEENEGVYLLDAAGKWHGPLEKNQDNATLVINSLYQRLKAMQIKVA